MMCSEELSKVLAFAFSNWEVIFRPLDIPLHRTDFVCLGAWPPINLTKCFMMDESLGHSVSVLTFNGLETKDQLCGSMLSSSKKSSGYQSMGYLPGLVIILCILLHTDTSRCNIPEDMETSSLQPSHTRPYVAEHWLLLIYIVLL